MRNSYYEKISDTYEYYVIVRRGEFKVIPVSCRNLDPLKAWRSFGWEIYTGPHRGYDLAMKSVSL
jgi:hypothetical protein